MLDFIIVGRGIAGSLLAYELLGANKKLVIISDDELPSSSKVAGGMFNPVTGKHLSETWLATELFPYLTDFYTRLENRFKVKFFHQTGIYRPFVNEKQKEQFSKIITNNNISNYCDLVEERSDFSTLISNPIGGVATQSAGWVDVPLLLEVLKGYFQSVECLVSEQFQYETLEIFDEYLIYKGIKAKQLIFCEGFLVTKNPFFNWLPFNPVKGETLLVEPEADYTISEIINQGSWIIPIQNSLLRIGATYSWHDLDFLPTQKALEQLISKVKPYFKAPFSVKNQQAGVRPSTIDRRLILGKHPKVKNLLIFNGLGTKGVSLAPYFAKEFRDFLILGKEFNSETTIERFYALYLD